jgi:hypothetical protein
VAAAVVVMVLAMVRGWSPREVVRMGGAGWREQGRRRSVNVVLEAESRLEMEGERGRGGSLSLSLSFFCLLPLWSVSLLLAAAGFVERWSLARREVGKESQVRPDY